MTIGDVMTLLVTSDIVPWVTSPTNHSSSPGTEKSWEPRPGSQDSVWQ
jgi:hypothetical protein